MCKANRNPFGRPCRAVSAALIMLAGALSGCGNEAPVAAQADTAADAGAGIATRASAGCDVDALTPICVQVALTGAVPAQGAQANAAVQDEAMKGSCAEYAAGGRDKHGRARFTLPHGLTEADHGPNAMFDIVIPGDRFHGAGAYAGDDLDIGEVSVGDALFKRGPETRVKAVLRADGGGSLDFSDMVATDGRRESGHVQWTCSP